MSTPANKSRILLIRHTEVDAAYRGVCYGQSDVPLSPAGCEACEEIAEVVSCFPVAHIIHTGLTRTRRLAEAIGQRTGVRPTAETALRERDFGTWELRTWDEIYADCGDDIAKTMSDPDVFRPGGGETTAELATRVWQWAQAWTRPGICVAVAHGGTIAALQGRQRSLPVAQWPALIPACGERVWYRPHLSGVRNDAADVRFAASESWTTANAGMMAAPCKGVASDG